MRSSLDRRSFLAASAAATLALPIFARAQQGGAGVPRFSTTNARWQAAYDAALDVLAGNVKVMPYVSKPVLIEGSVYQGIWQECGPHEALLYRNCLLYTSPSPRDS